MQNFIQSYVPTLGYGLYPLAHPTAELGLSRVLDAFFDDSLTPRVRDFAGHLTVKDNGDFEYKVDASGFRPEEVLFFICKTEKVRSCYFDSNQDYQ